jgi:hypothetical protein
MKSYHETILRRRWRVALAVLAAVLIRSETIASAGITFNTFVSSSELASGMGNTSTIGITYAGNKFVGTVYFGANNNQLYSTDLTGGNLQKFGDPIPGAGGEVVVGASLGQGGFAKGDIFAGSQNNGQIYHISNDGSTESLFATLPSGDVRQIFFDPGNTFGGNMIVTTDNGRIYSVDSSGTPTLIANIGQDTEGIDIAPSNWGTFTGDLLVASEGSGSLHIISKDPGHLVTDTHINVPSIETVSTVPLNLGASGNPVEGFYVANYPLDVQKAGASDFTPYIGDVIVTQELGSSSGVYAVQYNGGTSFSLTTTIGNPIGVIPLQSEDGIFVTAERINDINPVPEPSTLVMWSLMAGVFGAVWIRQRVKHAALAA